MVKGDAGVEKIGGLGFHDPSVEEGKVSLLPPGGTRNEKEQGVVLPGQVTRDFGKIEVAPDVPVDHEKGVVSQQGQGSVDAAHGLQRFGPSSE